MKYDLTALSKTAGWSILLTFLLSAQSLLITWSKVQGEYSYNSVTTILLAEVVKFFVAASILKYQNVPLNFRYVDCCNDIVCQIKLDAA
jgi:hypothetical protein